MNPNTNSPSNRLTPAELSRIGAQLARHRWAGVTPAERSRLMSQLARSIPKPAASLRAKRAWETKRRNAARILLARQLAKQRLAEQQAGQRPAEHSPSPATPPAQTA